MPPLFGEDRRGLNKDTSTIFAPATPVGESSVTVIRISGPDSIDIISKCFSKSKTELKGFGFSETGSHTAHHGYIFGKHGIIDEVIVTVFKNPNSYTGEDVVEISSHGGSYIYRKISSDAYKPGVRTCKAGRVFHAGVFKREN